MSFLSVNWLRRRHNGKKNSPNKIEATQGKFPVNYRKKLPLGHTNIEKLAK